MDSASGDLQEIVPLQTVQNAVGGYMWSLGFVFIDTVLPGFLVRIIFFTEIASGIYIRRVNGHPLSIEGPVIGLALTKLFGKKRPSMYSAVIVNALASFVQPLRQIQTTRMADKASYLFGDLVLKTRLLTTLVNMTLFYISFKLGILLVLLVATGVVVSLFPEQSMAVFMKVPKSFWKPLLWLAKIWAKVSEFVQLGTVPKIYRLLERVEEGQLQQDAIKLSKTPSYRYITIRSSRHFRVLVLERRRLFRLPRGRLEIVPLDDPSAHIACSYVWGSSHRTRKIGIEGRSLDITESAYQLLRWEQSFLSERRLWVDSICINQDDLEEKADQIQHMAEIYGTALWVDAFLGFGNQDNYLYSLLGQLIWRDTANALTESSVDNYILHDKNFRPLWDELAKLLNSPWFTRVWVLQEAVLAGDLYINYGRIRLRWFSFKKALLSLDTLLLAKSLGLSQSTKRQEFVGNLHGTALNLALIRDSLKRGKVESLYLLLVFFRTQQASNPLDKVYGLLSLAPKEVAKALPIDYNISMEDLFERTMSYVLEKEGLICLLSCEGSDNRRKIKSLPTWVIDWTADAICLTRADVPSYNAAPTTSQSLRGSIYGISPSPLNGKLLVHMMPLVDKVGDTVEVVSVEEKLKVDEIQKIIRYRHRWLSQARDIVLKLAGYEPADEESRKRAFYRTITYDREDPDDETTLHWDNDGFQSDYEFLERWLDIGGQYEGSPYDQLNSQIMKQLAQGTTLGSIVNGEALLDLSNTEANLLIEKASDMARLGKILARTKFAVDRRIGVTEGGHVGSFPRTAERGDEICLIAGAPAFFVVRQSSSNQSGGVSSRSIVGWCYLHGCMDGRLATGPWEPCYIV